MTTLKTLLALTLLALTVGCGTPSKQAGGTQPGQPLDPQGNWLFTFTGSNQSTADLTFGGQLFELHSPVVTSNEMPSAPFGFTCGGVTAAGQASETNTINLTVTAVDHANPPTFALTGTIAEDQAHMSGTWSTASAGDSGCLSDGSNTGAWSAQLIPAVSGNWTGQDSGVLVVAAITENTDQTSINMGSITGTLQITGSPCMSNGAYSLQDSTHLGETATISVTDGTATLTGVFTIDPATPGAATGNVFYAGGACDGQGFAFSLARQ